jgi:autotransporter passenger strand-loop-strand repeat protein
VVSGATALQGGYFIISSGGVASNIVTSQAGRIYVSSGGTVVGGTVTSASSYNGGIVNYGGVVSAVIVSGIITAPINGSANAGFIQISSGGTDLGVTLGSGGIEEASNGSAISTTVNSGGLQYVLSSGTGFGTIINSGGTAKAGIGTISGATVAGGGTIIAGDNYGDGGVTIGTILSSGAVEIVNSSYGAAGGTASNTTVSGGTLIVSSGGSLAGSLTLVGSGADLVVTDPSALTGIPISGFASAGDTIDLTGVASAAGAVMSMTAPGVAVLTVGGSMYTFDLPDVPYPDVFNFAADSGGGLEITGFAPCFLEGTRIATPDGEAAVEDLHQDDLVLTASGEAKPVRWVGYRHVIAAGMADAHLYAPVVIERDAIAEGKPARDLWVTPDHAIFAEGRLIPVKLLVNGSTIRQVPRPEYRFFHLELERHDLLLAEGLEAESYLDVEASRQTFANHGVTNLGLDLGITGLTEQAYAERGCHPLTLDPAAVKPVWDALSARAASRGRVAARPATSRDPALHLLANGQMVTPSMVADNHYRFTLTGAAGKAVIASRAASPWAMQPWLDDRRILGVAIASITVSSAAGSLAIGLNTGALAGGWYDYETAPDGRSFRWTDGAATLSTPALAGTCTVDIVIAGTLDYQAATSIVTARPIAASG